MTGTDPESPPPTSPGSPVPPSPSGETTAGDSVLTPRGEALERHFTFLGALHIALSSMVLLIALVAVGLFWGGAVVARNEDIAPLFALLGCLASGLLLLLALPGIIGGVGLLKRRRWSRILLIVVGALHLIHVPLGTLLGIYTLWVLLQPEVEEALVRDGDAA